MGLAEENCLTAPAIEAKIQEIVRRIVTQFAPDRIVLFGSHARGTAGPDSDVDLLVVKSVTGSRRAERLAIRMALRGVGVAKDVFVVTPEEVAQYADTPGTVIRPALHEGRLLYDRAG